MLLALLLLAALVGGWELGTKVLLGWEQPRQWGSEGVLPYAGERGRGGGGCSSPHRSCGTRNEISSNLRGNTKIKTLSPEG